MKTVIEVDNLAKTFKIRQKKTGWFRRAKYKSVRAVDGISFAVKKGECVAFIGPNGAGKSTTLKMLAAILTPTSGQAKILGLDPAQNRRELARKIGAVFGQRSQLWYHLPAMETFRLLAAVYDIPPEIHEKRVKKLITEFGLKELVNKPVRNLSLGERMRCEIAASLLHDPEILFLDEPTIGLDVSARAHIRELLKRQAKQEGKTVILTSHDTGDMESVCERVVMITRGKIVIDGATESLKRNYLKRKRISAIFDGKPPAVWEVDTSKTTIARAMADILKGGNILDITVEDPPMEEIIRGIYAREGEE